MIDHDDRCSVVQREGLCDCGAKLEKLYAKLAKVRAARPTTGLEMGALDIKEANLQNQIWRLEQAQRNDEQ